MKHIVVAEGSEYVREKIVSYMKMLFPESEVLEYWYLDDFLQGITYYHKPDIRNYPEDWLVIVGMKLQYSFNSSVSINAGINVLSEMEKMNFKCPAILESVDRVTVDTADVYNNLLGVVENESCVCQNFDVYRDMLSKYMKG